jgi:hypothetical protein
MTSEASFTREMLRNLPGYALMGLFAGSFLTDGGGVPLMTPEERGEPAERHARNGERRREFVRRWAEYIRSHPDEEWSRQAGVVVDAQIPAPDDDRTEASEGTPDG